VTLTRRSLLETGWKVLGSLLAAAATWTSWELLRPLRSAGATGKMKLGSPSQYEKDSATYVSAGRLWVANANGTLFALSQKCPHLGCRVPFCESSGRFECPCHGSVFDIGGEHIRGPAPRGMDQHPLSLDDAGDLVVDLSANINGPDPGANKYLTDPKGPACAGG
jgi:cytochrome b6-f complex iron-sulfur subunit